MGISEPITLLSIIICEIPRGNSSSQVANSKFGEIIRKSTKIQDFWVHAGIEIKIRRVRDFKI